ncbi:MAG: methyl-accepting chemotaxis protein, partial [Planctomycetota bacterium]
MLTYLKNLKLSTKLIATVILVIVAVVAVNYVVFMRGYSEDAKQALIVEAKVFTALADETKNHVSRLQAEGAFDRETLLNELLEAKAADPNYDYTKSRFFGTIPVVAGWTAAGEAAKREGLAFKIVSFDARNPKNEPTADPDPQAGQFRAELLRELEASAAAGAGDEIYAINETTNTLHYMRAIRLDASCMFCHGNPGDPKYDPDGDGKDPLGFQMEGWDPTGTHGAFEVQLPLDMLDSQIASFFSTGMMVTVPLVLGAGLGFVFLVRVVMSKPIGGVVAMLRDIAEGEGDLTKRLEVKSRDEIGQLATWFNTFVDKIHSVIQQVAGSAREVASAATEIAASSEQMAAGMERQQRQTGQVSAAVEEMAASVTEVASKAAEASAKAGGAGEQAAAGGEVVAR